MSPKTAKSIFLHAIDAVSPSDWSSYVAEASGNDRNLRDDVERLLEAHQQDDDLADQARGICDAVIRTVDHCDSELAGTTIGPYKLREQIGEGGMGVVFVAEQAEPVKRKVALKIVKPGMASKEVVTRFEAERQALAMMDHPNIAKVHDGGATATGQPYFVMELVQGPPVTDFCNSQRLSTRQRLQLMEQVCRAVQHAHQKGIIHRDLKPSNVLVPIIDGTPVPKVIDFGVAKATGRQLTEQTVYTQFSQLVGTPLYMSPEQAELGVVDVDTRSDVYSLGVLLYELLTDSTPFNKDTLREAGFDEMRRIIREEEPPKPSAKINTLEAASLSTVNDHRVGDRRRLSDVLEGELDWLVMKALEKDRNRRYESASALSADIRRYLAGEAVEACPPTIRYRIQKFAGRYRVAVFTTVVVLIALLLGIAGTSWQAWQAAIERDGKEAALNEARLKGQQAQQRAAESEALLNFFVDDLLGAIDPYKTMGNNVTVAEAVAEAERRIESEFKDQPLVQAGIRTGIGKIQLSLGYYGNAEDHLRRALDIRTRLLGEKDPATLETMSEMASLLHAKGKLKDARALTERTWRLKRATLGPNHADTLREQFYLSQLLGRFGDRSALSMRENVWESMRRELGPTHIDTLRAQWELAVAYQGHQVQRSKTLAQQTLQQLEESFGPDHPKTLYVQYQLDFLTGNIRISQLEKMLSSYQRLFGSVHPKTLYVHDNVIEWWEDEGDLKKALAMNRAVLEEVEQQLGEGHPRSLGLIHRRVGLLRAVGQDRASMDLAETACQIAERRLGPIHPERLSALERFAQALAANGDFQRAELAYRQALHVARQLYGPEVLESGRLLIRVGEAQLQQEHDADAEATYREAWTVLQRAVGEGHAATLFARYHFGLACHRQGKSDEARGELSLALETARAEQKRDSRHIHALLSLLRDICRDVGDHEASYDYGQQLGEWYYHVEDWHSAGDTFTSASDVTDDPTSQATSLLWAAMAYWQEAVHANRIRSRNQWLQARENYDQAVATMDDAGRSPEFEELRERAAEMISHQEARRHLDALSAKIAEAPEDRTLLYFRARLYSVEESWELAAADWARTIELSDDSRLRPTELLDWPEVFPLVLKLLPEDTRLWITRAKHHVLHSRWLEALSDYANGKPLHTVDDTAFEYAGVLLLAGDQSGYEQVCVDLASRSGEPNSPHAAYVVSRTCAIGPTSEVTTERMIAWAAEGLSIEKAYVWHAMGLAQFRAGQYEQAINSLEKSNGMSWRELSKAQNWLVLAMSHELLRNTADAEAAFEHANEIIRVEGPKRHEVSLPPPDWIALQLLRRETEAMFEQDLASDSE